MTTSSISPSALSCTLYNESFHGSQSELFLYVVEKVLKRHPDCVEDLTDFYRMHAFSAMDFTKKENCDSPDYNLIFRLCRWFEIGDKGICVGYCTDFPHLLHILASLLLVCGENPDVLEIEGYTLPVVRRVPRRYIPPVGFEKTIN